MNAINNAGNMNLALKTATEFSGRTLSLVEYYHACAGVSGKTLETAREITLVLEGDGALDVDQFECAVRAAAAVNPGARLRLVGNSLQARWCGDGVVPRVRVEPACAWNGQSQAGADFIRATPLSVRDGLCAEFIITEPAPCRPRYLIFRCLHAAMDGLGCMHFLQEVFRALRGEPLHGSNAFFRDTDLIRSLSTGRPVSEGADQPRLRPAFATGGPRGTETGDCWQRIDLDGLQPWLVPRIGAVISEFAHQFGEGVARIAVPVNLRRHLPGLVSTMNFTGLQYIDMFKGDTAMHFQRRLHQGLAQKRELVYPRALAVVRVLPLGWLERLTCRTPNNYLKHRIAETAMLSDLGMFRSADFSGGGFAARRLFGLPISGNTFGLMCALDNRVAITLGMPAVYASEGRLAALVDRIRYTLAGE